MKFPAIYYRIIKDRNIRIAVAIIIGMILTVFLWAWFTVGDLTTPQARAAFLREHPAVTRVLPIYWQIRKLTDVTYLAYAFKSDSVPNYQLEISDNNVREMDASLPEGFMGVVYTNKISVPARFTAGNQSFDVDARYRGDNAVHWNAAKKSYQVRLQGKDSFQGLTEMNFIIPDDRYFAIEHFNNYRAGKLGLNHPVSGFANLSVNGTEGLYFMIEGWSKEMLSKWGVPDDSLFYGEKDLEATGGDLWADLSNWQTVVGNDAPEKFAPLSELLRLLNKAGDSEFNAKIFELVDKDNFYAWQIHQELANSTHQAIGNVRLYFDKSKNKFFFVPWDVEIEDPHARDNFEYYGPLAKRIFSNPEFLEEKRKRLYGYVSDEKNLEDDLAFYDRTYESFKISLYRDRTKIYTNRFADSVYEQRRQMIVDIFRQLKEHLESLTQRLNRAKFIQHLPEYPQLAAGMNGLINLARCNTPTERCWIYLWQNQPCIFSDSNLSIFCRNRRPVLWLPRSFHI